MKGTNFTTFQPAGLATGIGSLPFTDAQPALALIGDHLPKIPHWPQLPQRGSGEHFVHQFLQPLIDHGLLRVDEGRRFFDTDKHTLPERLTAFYESCLEAESGDALHIGHFMPPGDSAAGLYAFLEHLTAGTFPPTDYVKGQIVGPLTVGLTVNDHQGRPAYYHDELRDVLVRTLAVAAHGQASALQQSGKQAIIFVDDPAISAWGSRLHLALDRDAIRKDLDAIFSAIRSAGAISGLHACQAIDWSIALSTSVQILSVDAYRYGGSLKPHVKALRGFMEAGGVIAWGIVPTLDDPFSVTVEALFKRLNELWRQLFDEEPQREILVRQSLITPACGLGLLSRSRAERIYRLTDHLSQRIREAADERFRSVDVLEEECG